jgi:hypothetical protein
LIKSKTIFCLLTNKNHFYKGGTPTFKFLSLKKQHVFYKANLNIQKTKKERRYENYSLRKKVQAALLRKNIKETFLGKMREL